MKKRFSEEQIIGFLREADKGIPVKELCRKHGFSDASFYLWRGKFGGSPQLWLPKVWGKGKPQFQDLQELNHFAALVMGLYNEIAGCFEQDPATFAPSFYEQRFDDQTVVIVDE